MLQTVNVNWNQNIAESNRLLNKSMLPSRVRDWLGGGSNVHRGTKVVF